MWLVLSLVAMLCWSGSDLFSKIGCADGKNKTAPLKMLVAVGLVMGLHAGYGLLFGGVAFSPDALLTYLPVSLLYILSMAIGYLGLRYIELSVSSPVCNSSGALVTVLTVLTAGVGGLAAGGLCGAGLCCVGVVALGIVEAKEDPALRAARQEKGNFRYSKSVLALLLPVIYCLLDALGTFADSRVLVYLEEESANTAYELTFFAVGLLAAIYLYGIKRERLFEKTSLPRLAGAAFETVGQVAYIYALADTAHVALAAPVISAYCALSVVWGGIFLKERLSFKHYLCIAAVLAGIVLMAVFEG